MSQKTVYFLLLIIIPSSFSSSRTKRGILELGLLVESYTPYTSSQLLNHGNYCGIGGNRGLDGSVKDDCDSCCKAHGMEKVTYRH